MRLAIFSDVHSNLEALQAFLRRIKEQKVDRICCLGDLVGYGPNPNECVEVIRSHPKMIVVLGNHDWAVNNRDNLSVEMSPVALEAILYTDKILTDENRAYLQSLVTTIDMGPFTFVHASAFRPLKWQYVRQGKAFRTWMCMRHAVGRIVAVGHTHAPALLDAHGSSVIPGCDFANDTVFHDDGRSRFLLNPGSLGQPRDRVMRPSYVIYDTRAMTITWHRLMEYDCHITLQKILKSDLPDECASYLLS